MACEKRTRRLSRKKQSTGRDADINCYSRGHVRTPCSAVGRLVPLFHYVAEFCIACILAPVASASASCAFGNFKPYLTWCASCRRRREASCESQEAHDSEKYPPQPPCTPSTLTRKPISPRLYCTKARCTATRVLRKALAKVKTCAPKTQARRLRSRARAHPSNFGFRVHTRTTESESHAPKEWSSCDVEHRIDSFLVF